MVVCGSTAAWRKQLQIETQDSLHGPSCGLCAKRLESPYEPHFHGWGLHGKAEPHGENLPQKNRDQEAVAEIFALRGAEMDVATRAGGTQIVKHDVPWSAQRSLQERYPHWLKSWVLCRWEGSNRFGTRGIEVLGHFFEIKDESVGQDCVGAVGYASSLHLGMRVEQLFFNSCCMALFLRVGWKDDASDL